MVSAYNKKWDFNKHVTGYVAAGASAEIIEGGFVTAELGARSCWEVMRGTLCFQGAYEENQHFDIVAEDYLGVERKPNYGYKFSSSFEMRF